MAVQLDFQLAGGAAEAAQQFADLLSEQGSAIVKVSDAIAKFDVSTQELTQSFKALAADGSTATVTFKEMNNQLELVSVKTDSATSSLKNYLAEQARITSEGFKNQANQAEALIPISGTGFSPAEASSIEGSIQRVRASIESGSVSLARFQELLHAIQSNPQAILPNLTADEARITASLRSIFNNLDQVQKKAGQSVSMQGFVDAANKAEAALAQFANRPGLNVNQVNQFEAAMLKVRSAIESGSVSLERFQQIFSTLQSNRTAIIPGLTEEETKVTRALREMMEGFKKTGQEGADSGQKILISWQGVFRLFEAQVIKRVAGALQSSIAESVKDSADFSTRIAEIQTISQKAGISTDEWTSSLRELSKQFGASNADVAEAAYQSLSSQVVKGVDTFGHLESILKFSRVSLTSAADSAKLLDGALRSFNLTQEDTNRVAGIFFKTIELGRVRGKDMADTFGRVGSIAHEAGLSLEEVGAAIVTITNKGVPFSDASTLITNLLLKLIRPTAEMTGLFKEWGVASGSAAISTFGFEGVLKRLDDEAQKGSSRFGELFNQIRALRGAFNLTGSSFGGFSKNLIDIKAGQEQFEKAGDIMGEALGTRLKKQGQEIKTFFAEDFGDRIVSLLVSAGDKITLIFGSITNALQLVEKGIKLIGGSYLIYISSSLAATIATRALNLVLANQTGVWLTNAVGLTTLSTALQAKVAADVSATVSTTGLTSAAEAQAAVLSKLQLAIGAFAVGFTIGQYLFSNDDVERLKQVEASLEKITSLKYKNSLSKDPENDSNKKLIDDLRARFDKNFQISSQYYAKQLALVEGLKARSIDALKDTNDALKISSKTLFDSFSNNISELRKKITESESAIKQSLKTSEDITRRQGEIISSAQFKYADPGRISAFTGLLVDNQRIELMKTKIQDITAFARQEYKTGTKESVDDARKLFAEAEKLTGQLFDEEIRKQRAEFDERVKRGTEKPKTFEFDASGQAKAIYEFKVKTEPLQERLNALVQEQLKLEEDVRKSAENIAKLKAAQIETEKENLRTIQQSFAELEKISLFDKKGGVKTEFASDPRSALAEFDRLREKIQGAFNDSDAFKQFQVASDLAKQRIALANEVAVAEKEIQLKTEQEKITIAKKSVQDRITNIQEELSAANSKITQFAAKLEKDVGVAFSKDIEDVFSKIDKSKLGGIGGPNENALEIASLKKNLTDLKATVEATNEAFANNRSADNFDKLKKAVSDFTTKYQELSQKVKETQGLDIIPEAEQARIDKIKSDLANLAGGANSLKEAKVDLRGLVLTSNDFQRTLQDIPGALDAMAENAAKSAPTVARNIGQITGEVGLLIQNLKSAIDKINELNLQLPQIRGQRLLEADKEFFGGYPKYMNAGGFVGFVPRGSDTIPAMLNPHEFVMTESATNQFLPILKAMNSGGLSRGSGSSNVTNVGDITINVQGGNTSADTLKNVAKGLRRGIRRGTIIL